MDRKDHVNGQEKFIHMGGGNGQGKNNSNGWEIEMDMNL